MVTHKTVNSLNKNIYYNFYKKCCFFLLYALCTKKLCFKGKLRKIKENDGSLVIKEFYEKEGIFNFLSIKTQLLNHKNIQKCSKMFKKCSMLIKFSF